MAGKGFRQLSENLAELAKVPSRISSPVAARLNSEIQREFQEERDPYGDAWNPLAASTARRKGHARILYESGTLMRETRALPMAGAGVRLESVDYGRFHQEGTGSRHRPIFPDQADLPEEWQDVIDEELTREFGRVMR